MTGGVWLNLKPNLGLSNDILLVWVVIATLPNSGQSFRPHGPFDFWVTPFFAHKVTPFFCSAVYMSSPGSGRFQMPGNYVGGVGGRIISDFG